MSAIPAALARTTKERHRALPVALALGRVEARRLLRHPASVVGAMLVLAIPVVASWNEVPVLNRYDALTNESLIPFGAGVLIAAHLGTMRARRHRTTELFDSLVTSTATMTSAHLVAVAFAAAFALVLVVAELVFMKAIGGVTMPRPEVVMIGPALVAFAGAFGVALGRWAPRLFAAPLGLVGIVAVCIPLMTNSHAHNREWLSPWVPSEVLAGSVSELSLRPYAWRLLYLTGLAFVAAAIAFTHIRRLRIIAIGLTTVALVGTAFAGYGAMQPVPRSEQRTLAADALDEFSDRVCREHDSIRYCALKGYADWIDRWRKPVEGVVSAIPVAARPNDLRINQSPTENDSWGEHANLVFAGRLSRSNRKGESGSGMDIRPSLHWGRNSAEGKSEFALALAVAANVTGVDSRFRVTEADVIPFKNPRRQGLRVGRRQRGCYALEQGRSIVAMWLAARATEGARTAFEGAAAEIPYITHPDDASRVEYFSPQLWAFDEYTYEFTGEPEVTWGTREAAYTGELLQRDEAEVSATVAANWKRLVDPSTTSDEAATILSLEPLPPLGEAIESWGYFKRYRGIQQFGVPQCH